MKINEQVIWELIKYIFSYIQYIFLSKKGKLESNLRLDEPPPPTRGADREIHAVKASLRVTARDEGQQLRHHEVADAATDGPRVLQALFAHEGIAGNGRAQVALDRTEVPVAERADDPALRELVVAPACTVPNQPRPPVVTVPAWPAKGMPAGSSVR